MAVRYGYTGGCCVTMCFRKPCNGINDPIPVSLCSIHCSLQQVHSNNNSQQQLEGLWSGLHAQSVDAEQCMLYDKFSKW